MLPIEIGCGEIGKMPRGPEGEKRPADVIGNALKSCALRPALKARSGIGLIFLWDDVKTRSI
jgi:hypothetical protein